ncbi:gap junction alpha-4 protein-like [Acipenser ruthenus]|uniref:gap junction alpha-4 protein-like n=1 Tax=Acipenser ruthenus TaxID=7906 RepID=UPI002740E853|nr:gap junction alpha-4 protein-like [Acipenser ruthenus]
MADWSLLEKLLGEVQEHSTGLGQAWLTVLFVFRVLVLCTAAESAWDDEQADFTCNTLQPGCQPVCYDRCFPISHFRYFVLQIIFVSTPTLLYLGHVAWRAGRARKRGEEEEEGGAELKGVLMLPYTLSVVCKVILETGFLLGLWFLYGFTIQPLYVCQGFPCPHQVDCYVSRPTEKTVFTIYMQGIAVVSLLLNLIELLHLLAGGLMRKARRLYWGGRRAEEPTLKPGLPENGFVCLPASGPPAGPPQTWACQAEQRTAAPQFDQLPQYGACVGPVKAATSNKPADRRSASRGSEAEKKQYV